MPKLKICGNHRTEDILTLMEHIERIDYVGFIFTPKSKRYVSAEQVTEWIQEYPVLAEKAVAVFLDQDINEMIEILFRTKISIVQLHGHERVEDIKQLKNRIGGMKDTQRQNLIWKVLHIDATERNGRVLRVILEQMEQYRKHVDAFLLDTKIKGQLGGTGQSFDWGLLADLPVSLVDHPVPIWVAGGINDQNVAGLISQYPVYGVDVASGVETNGTKDRNKVNNLIEGVSKDEAK